MSIKLGIISWGNKCTKRAIMVDGGLKGGLNKGRMYMAVVENSPIEKYQRWTWTCMTHLYDSLASWTRSTEGTL